ncbi:hypothetical protein [Lactobacillus terrae]|uniref:hypothetical protein n=1 Tax=Lactobacillus terrae TaxID=2269374 RepID=UPI000C1B6F5C|nr:hypothetical protein [Lactobacillus terrae]
MSDSRRKLSKFVGQKILCSGIFNKLTHKHNKNTGNTSPVILLTDIHILNDDFSNRDLVANHVWINVTKGMFQYIDKELFNGDLIVFSAKVSTYNIVRDDVLQKRDNLYQEMKQKNDIAFKQYREKYLDWEDEWQTIKDTNDYVYQEYTKGNYSFDEMQKIQKQNIKAYQNRRPNIDSTSKKQQKQFEKSQREQQDLKLVDYQLQEIKIPKKYVNKFKLKRVYYGWERQKYDNKRINETKYTKYLAARSMAYYDKKPYDKFARK